MEDGEQELRKKKLKSSVKGISVHEVFASSYAFLP